MVDAELAKVFAALAGGAAPGLEVLELKNFDMDQTSLGALELAIVSGNLCHLRTFMLGPWASFVPIPAAKVLRAVATMCPLLRDLTVLRILEMETFVAGPVTQELVRPGAFVGLEELCIRLSMMGDEGMRALGDGLLSGTVSYANTLKYLEYYEVHFDFQPDGIKPLAFALGAGACPQLQHLMLGAGTWRGVANGRDCGDDMVAQFAKALGGKSLPNLRILDLSQARMRLAGARALAEALEEGCLPSLRGLYVTLYGEEELDLLETALEESGRDEDVYLSWEFARDLEG